MDVEVAKEDEHDHHVAGQQVLTPAREVAPRAYRVDRVREGDAELQLQQQQFKFIYLSHLASLGLHS